MLASSNYRILRGHYGGITQMLFLPNGNLVSCSYDGAIKVWEQESGKQIQDLRGDKHLASVISIACLSDTDLAGGYADGYIRIWNLKNGSLTRTLKVEPSSSSVHPAIHSLTALPGNRLAFSTCDNVIKMFDLNEDVSTKPPSSINNEGASTDFLPLGVSSSGYLVSYHWHREGKSSINVWNPVSGEMVRSVKVENSLADCFKVLSGEKVAVGSGHGTIKVIDLNTGTNQLSLVKCHRDGVWSVEEHPNGSLITGGSIQDATINAWNMRTGEQVASVKAALIGYDEHISSVCVTKDGRVLASAGTYSDVIKLWSSFIN